MRSANDPLQTSGALVPETAVPTETPGTGPAIPGPHPVDIVRRQYRRRISKTPDIRMIPGAMTVGGRRLRFAVSNNERAYGPAGPGSEPVWAVNVHGYFAGGGMYWRESARLAERLGWRLINPSLPGFGGSDSLDWDVVSMASLAEQVEHIVKHVGAGPVVVLGHSMGGAVAIEYASRNRVNTLGVIYRDGVATPAWRVRTGLIPSLVGRVAPDMAPIADLMAAVILDTPDIFLGRLYATMRSVLPDVRRNIRTMGHTLPVGSMLMTVDLRSEVRTLSEEGMPLLAEWGCFDRVTTAATAYEFAEVSKRSIQWVPGGHSWMLARPQGQADVLEHLRSGRQFVHDVEDRWRRLLATDRNLRAVP